jgi:hypothetical protein
VFDATGLGDDPGPAVFYPAAQEIAR